MSTLSIQSSESAFLRRAIRGNGIFSLVSGLASLLAARPLAQFVGLEMPVVLQVLGVGLILYAGALFWVTGQASLDKNMGKTAVFLDILWVIGSVILLLADWLPFTVAGKWTVALLAETVATFAILQTYGVWKMKS